MLEENKYFLELASRFLKPNYQLNKTLESDAEIIHLNDCGYLALTTDSISEEIATGLYEDHYLAGWMSVVANLSDLAAVGAQPLGLLLNQSLPSGLKREKLESLLDGIHDACSNHKTYILGGDTNESKEWNLGATAIGIIYKPPIIMRKGAKPNHHLFSTGPLGQGNAYAFNRFINNSKIIEFLPKAKLQEGKFIRKWASACIDSSDGLIPALSNLMELNNIGIELTLSTESLVENHVLEVSESNKIPLWIFLSGPHGEYELIFTIRENDVNAFKTSSKEAGFNFLHLGKCISKSTFNFLERGTNYKTNPFSIANEFKRCQSDPYKYLQSLLIKDQKWKKSKTL